MKDLNKGQIAAIKRQFKNSLPALKKIKSIDEKIEKLQKEKEILEKILNGGEAGIIAMTDGYRSIDLINCEYVPQFNEDGTPKMDKDGKYQLRTQVLTFVPPVEAIDDSSEDAINIDVLSEEVSEVTEEAPEVEDSFPFNE